MIESYLHREMAVMVNPVLLTSRQMESSDIATFEE